MPTRFENYSESNSSSLSKLENKAREIERTLVGWREMLEHELGGTASPGEGRQGDDAAPIEESYECGEDQATPDHTVPDGYTEAATADPDRPPDERTRELISHGRRSARSRRLSRAWWLTAIAATGIAVVIMLIALGVFQGSASWPPSVATVQAEIATACRNPDVASEPGQVNFACAQDTRQILWVFALMTSVDKPNFDDQKTGREGLEPITPTQGGEVAWSLNLHHPYNPYNPIDSLQVAARAINNIIGGATVTSSSGKPEVQSGLESSPTDCAIYTGSAAIISRQGYPGMCAAPVTSQAGLGALVADAYQDWMVGASPTTAQDAAVLFENASNPSNPQVQAILKSLNP